jgi:hypothetical protein
LIQCASASDISSCCTLSSKSCIVLEQRACGCVSICRIRMCGILANQATVPILRLYCITVLHIVNTGDDKLAEVLIANGADPNIEVR